MRPKINIKVSSTGTLTVVTGQLESMYDSDRASQAPGGGGGNGRLDGLTDVVEGSASDNMTLVYDQDTDKYVVDYLDMDGGSF